MKKPQDHLHEWKYPAPSKVKVIVSGIQLKNCQACTETRKCDPSLGEKFINWN